MTYNTSLSFEPHISNIKIKCQPRLNALRAVTGSTFGQDKESCSAIYKQYIRSVMDYASPAWAPDLSRTHLNTLQTTQNKALKIITGCTQTSPTDHLHHETSILKFEDHLNMRGTQFLPSATHNQDHPCSYMSNINPTPRRIVETPAGHYGDILEGIPTTDRSHGNEIHTAITARSIAALGPNSILGVPPPKIHQSERDLPRQDRIHLSRLRCGHHPALQAYQHRINSNNPPECPNCGTQPHTVIHVMEECEDFAAQRTAHGIEDVRDLWAEPARSIGYLRDMGLLAQR